MPSTLTPQKDAQDVGQDLHAFFETNGFKSEDWSDDAVLGYNRLEREWHAASGTAEPIPRDEAKLAYYVWKHAPSKRKTKPAAIGGYRPMPGSADRPRVARRGDRSYAGMFAIEQLDDGGFESVEDFYDVVAGGRADERLTPLRAAHEFGTPSAGGYIVPEAWVAQMLDASLESEIVRPRARIEPMETEIKHIGGFENTDSSGGTLYGGFSAQWVGESDSITEATGKLRKLKLQARKLALFTKSSNELLQSGTGFEEQLTEVLTRAAGWHLDYAFLRGTGAGQPRGVLNDPSLVTVSKETGQDAATIVYENVANMFARLHPSLVEGSVWVANPTTIPQLLQLNITIGTGGSTIPVMSSESGEFRMLTRPVLFTEKLPALGTVGDLILANFSQYSVGIRRGFSIESSSHLGFQTDETAWRGIIRADGQGRWESAYTPNSGDTQSWCVALATRS